MSDPFTFISTFSGVGGFDIGLEQAGMTCIAQIEYDPHWRCKNGHEFVPELGEAAGPCATIIPKTQATCGQPMKPPLPAEKQYRPQVLERHWPGVARYGDIRAVSLQPNGLQERELGGARSGGTNPKGRKKLSRHAGLQRATSDEQSEPQQSTTEQPLPHAGRGRASIADLVSDEPDGRGGADTQCRGNGRFGEGSPASSVDLICGGFPCQDLSVAGKRAGLSGSRSGLWWEFERIIGEVRPAWILIENVPGLLSSNGGDDFALILSALEELGYGWAYRILDSRFFGVPQRRRRVYIVGHSSGRIDYPASVLFESEGGTRDSEASGEAGEDVAATLISGTGGARGWRGDDGSDTYVASLDGDPRAGRYLERGDNLIANPLGAKDGYRLDLDHETYIPEVAYALTKREHKGVSQRESVTNLVAGTVTGSEGHNGNSNPIPDNYVCEQADSLTIGANQTYGFSGDIAATRQSVRRLTPVECERLQGFPDNWTHGVDGPRYAAMGDAVTVPVIRWLGERMMFVEESLRV